MPPVLLEAVEKGDSIGLKQVVEMLSPEKQQAVEQIFWSIRNSQQFKPLLRAIAEVAAGDRTRQHQIEADLDDLEKGGWHLKEAVERIWSGERDGANLTKELDRQDASVIHWVLEIIGRK